MSIVIAGGAGFIGSTLARHLAQTGERILILDNLVRGKKEYVEPLFPQAIFQKVNLAEKKETLSVLTAWHERDPVSEVWHMAANSDIPAGTKDATVDFGDTFLTTFNILEAMRKLNITRLLFASSSAIYGDQGAGQMLTEESGPLLPISNYGAMKLASEAVISAAVESWLAQSWIFRFPNVVGVPATHGVILDFIKKLRADPHNLQVLGDGTQQKIYLHVEELVNAMLFIRENTREKRNIYNIGPVDSGCTVSRIAEMVRNALSPQARIIYGSENRGWVGDVPRFKYSVAKLKNLGWTAQQTSTEAIGRAITEIIAQEMNK